MSTMPDGDGNTALRVNGLNNDGRGLHELELELIAITGALDLSGAGTDDIVLDITSLTAGDVPGDVPNFGESDEQWIILTTTTGVTGFDAADWSVLVSNFDSTPAAGGTWSVSQIGDDVVLSYTAIPEPTVATLLLAGASLGFLTLRRKRQS